MTVRPWLEHESPSNPAAPEIPHTVVTASAPQCVLNQSAEIYSHRAQWSRLNDLQLLSLGIFSAFCKTAARESGLVGLDASLSQIFPAATALFRAGPLSFVPEDGLVAQWNAPHRDDPSQSAFGKAIR